MIDSAPSYGRAEEVVGTLLSELKNRDKYFLATKVSVAAAAIARRAAAQMEASFQRLKTDHIDLMQIWNVSQPELLAPRARRMEKGEDAFATRASRAASKDQYAQLEAAMKAYKYDFVQIDLAIDNRSARGADHSAGRRSRHGAC